MLATFFSVLPVLVSAAVLDVQVGKGGLSFTPEAVSANVGDQVVFHFVAKNHTATQSSFASPCGPMSGGFDSGFQAVAADSTDFPTFTYNVTGTTPIWVYCKQAANTPQSHCGQGMVFAINCPSGDAPNSFDNFKKSALAIGAQLAAGSSAASATPTAAPTDTPQSVTVPITLESSTWTTTYASVPNSPNPTPASLEGNVHVVTVGGNGSLTFDPPQLVAAPRDTISFQFVAKNHTATQSSFASPCRKLASTSTTSQVGFDSGFMFISNGSSPMVYNVTVNDTAPIWVYCRQTAPVDHCGSGMVFAVNSDETSGSAKTFADFQSSAKAQNGTNATTSASGSAPNPTSGAERITAGLSFAIAALTVLAFL